MLWLLATASFLVLFQIYLIAPLVPSLAKDFNASENLMGLAVPAYTIPYGLSTLFYGALSDRYGRRPILIKLFGIMAVLTLLLGFSNSAAMFLFLRVLLGISTGGIVPIAIALIGDSYPYESRGKPIGLLYAAMSGGMALGSTIGAYLNPVIGWRNEFIITGVVCLGLFMLCLKFFKSFDEPLKKISTGAGTVIINSFRLLKSKSGWVLYACIFFNGVFHSGIFSWLGYYFVKQYNLDDKAIGIALLGYGIPGMLMGVRIGKMADRSGRKKLIKLGLIAGALSVLMLCFNIPIWGAAAAVAVLSLGYDMTQPLFAGMVTEIGSSSNRGQAVSLSACLLFLGYGMGALLFQGFLQFSLTAAFTGFILLELSLLFFSRNLIENK